MRKNDFILIGIVLGAAALFFLFRGFFATGGGMLEITVGGELYGTYSLSEDQTIEIGEGNTCRIEDGRASMIWADCPDQICVHHSSIGKDGGNIVCLPNQVFLSVMDGQKDAPVDSVAS